MFFALFGHSCHTPVGGADAGSSGLQCGEESLYLERVGPAQRRGWYPTLLDESELPDCKLAKRCPIDNKPAELDDTCCHSYGIRGYVDHASVIPQPVSGSYEKHLECGCIASSTMVSSGYGTRGPYGTLSTTVVDYGGPTSTLLRRAAADQSTSKSRDSVVTSSRSSSFHVIGNPRQQQVSTQLLQHQQQLQQQPDAAVGTTIQNGGDYGHSFNV